MEYPLNPECCPQSAHPLKNCHLTATKLRTLAITAIAHNSLFLQQGPATTSFQICLQSISRSEKVPTCVNPGFNTCLRCSVAYKLGDKIFIFGFQKIHQMVLYTFALTLCHLVGNNIQTFVHLEHQISDSALWSRD